MSWNNINEPNVGEPTKKQSFARLVIQNLIYLYNQIASLGGSGGSDVANGGFESDTDNDGTPDGWTVTLFPGGSFVIDSTTQAEGTKSAKFTHPGGAGNGGGYIQTNDFSSCSELRSLNLNWTQKASVAGIRAIVQVLYYDSAKAFLSTQTAYDSQANATAWTDLNFLMLPPAGARYYKLKFVGGDSSVNVAGSVWFDGVRVGEDKNKTPRGVVVFTSSGTWTAPAYINRVKVRVWGGGGGGGFSVTNGSHFNGGGGGGGGYAESLIAVTPGADYAITVGAGGAASANGGQSRFAVSGGATLVSANGGTQGADATAGGSGTGGAGGSGSGDHAISGGNGGDGITDDVVGAYTAARGGNSPCGGQGGKRVNGAIGAAGQAPGGGGGGFAAGAAGRVVIEY